MQVHLQSNATMQNSKTITPEYNNSQFNKVHLLSTHDWYFVSYVSIMNIKASSLMFFCMVLLLLKAWELAKTSSNLQHTQVSVIDQVCTFHKMITM